MWISLCLIAYLEVNSREDRSEMVGDGGVGEGEMVLSKRWIEMIVFCGSKAEIFFGKEREKTEGYAFSAKEEKENSTTI